MIDAETLDFLRVLPNGDPRDLPFLPGGTLALDPALSCGWAYVPPGCSGPPTIKLSGTWKLSKAGEDHGARFARLRDRIVDIRPSRIVFELVERHEHRKPGQRHASPNFRAAHNYGGLLAIIEEYAYRERIAYEGFNVVAIKRQATGKGGGKGTAKADILARARQRYGYQVETDDQADALFLLELAIGFPSIKEVEECLPG